MSNETKKSKICYVLPSYDSDTDTHFSYLYDFIDRLGREMDVFLVIEKTKGTPSFDSTAATHMVTRGRTYLTRFFSLLKLMFSARRQGYRVFYVHYSFVGALAALVVTTFGGGSVLYWNCGMPWLYRRNFLREVFFRFILRNTRLVTGTHSLSDGYVRHYRLDASKVIVLPNWIDVESTVQHGLNADETKLDLDIPMDKQVVLFVHRLANRKGADLIVPVARRFRNEEVVFIVVGDGPEYNEIVSQINAEGLDSQVHLKGRIPHRDVSRFFAVADVFFMPSDEEGFPHVLLEAMASGVPYVATEVGGVREISPQSQQPYIVADRSPESLESTLRSLLTDPPAKETLQEHVVGYDTSTVVPQYVEVYERVADEF